MVNVTEDLQAAIAEIADVREAEYMFYRWKRSVKMESHFDGLSCRSRSSIRSQSRPKPPVAYRRNRFFVQAQPQPFDHLYVRRAAFCRDNYRQQYNTLILGLHRLIGKFRMRTIHARRGAITPGSRVEDAAARAAALSGANATATAAPNSAAAS